MNITKITCPACNASIEVQDNEKRIKCPYFGTVLNIDNIDNETRDMKKELTKIVLEETKRAQKTSRIGEVIFWIIFAFVVVFFIFTFIRMVKMQSMFYSFFWH